MHDPVERWLLDEARLIATTPPLMAGLIARLNEDGLDVLRMNVQIRTLHREVQILMYVWRPQGAASMPPNTARVVEARAQEIGGAVVTEIALAHGSLDTTAFRASPFHAVYATGETLRCRIDPAATPFAYPVLEDLASIGATDYAAFAVRFQGDAGSALSFATRKRGGFTDDEIARLGRLLGPLTSCLQVHAMQHAMRTLLHTYLGRGPGERVLAGQVRRGQVERLEAAIWFSDLRGFTRLAEALPPATLIAWLDEYFGEVTQPIQAGGGEVLKFIGDAVLAVFPETPERSRAMACRAALTAALEADAALSALNARRAGRGEPPLGHGIALHVGDVLYGNIGAAQRLDFTVIGQAVNLAARLEGLCGCLGRSVLASAAVNALSRGEGPALEPLGAFELKGIDAPVEVFGVLPVDTP